VNCAGENLVRDDFQYISFGILARIVVGREKRQKIGSSRRSAIGGNSTANTGHDMISTKTVHACSVAEIHTPAGHTSISCDDQ